MAAADRLTTYSDQNFVRMNHFPHLSEPNAVVKNSPASGLYADNAGYCSLAEHMRRCDAKKLGDIQAKMWDAIRNLFGECSAVVKELTVHSSCMQHSSRFRKKCKVLLINGMKSSDWHQDPVDGLLNFLVSNKKDFTLVIVSYEDDLSDIYDTDLCLDFRFIWQGTGFVCSVEEFVKGFEFKKDLELIEQPSKKDYYLMSEKRKDLCVVMDGEQIQLEPRHANSYITVWTYSGSENDRNSRHFRSPDLLTVFGLKLNSINSDATKCLGAANKDTVGLMQATIPDHGKFIPTKTDNRFFYRSTTGHGCSMFESTQYENHFLAIKDSDEESVSPYLYLKEITNDKEYDEEILFQMCIKHE